jgi:1-phosphofructokinase family hexose kinase
MKHQKKLSFRARNCHPTAMQLVVSLNPAVDVEWRVESVRWEEKNQVLSERRWPGGKGINVARFIDFLGGDPRLLLPLGGANGEEMARGLRDLRLRFRRITLREPSRANVVVTTAGGGQLRFNPLGPRMSLSEWREVLATAKQELNRADLLILSGALPRGVARTAYAELIKLAHDAGVKSILDCDGPSLKAGIKGRPFLVKPNEFELAQWYRKPLRSAASVARAARALSDATGGWVLVSRGPKGALLVGSGKNLMCRAPSVRVLNTIGAGDALVAAAALAIGRGAPVEDWLTQGVAAGTAVTECQAGESPGRRRIDELARELRAQLPRAANK